MHVKLAIFFIIFSIVMVSLFAPADAIKSSGHHVTRTSSTGTDNIVCGITLCSDRPLSTIEKIISFVNESEEPTSEIVKVGSITQQAAIIVEEPDVTGLEIQTKTTDITSQHSKVFVDFGVIDETSLSDFQKLYLISIDPETSIDSQETQFTLNVDMTSPKLISAKTIEILPPSQFGDSNLIQYDLEIEQEQTKFDALQINLPTMNKFSTSCCAVDVSTQNIHVSITQIHETGPIQIKSLPLNEAENFNVDLRGSLMYIPSTEFDGSEILITSDVFYITKVASSELDTISFGSPIIISYLVPDELADLLMSKIRLFHNSDGVWEDITIDSQIVDIDYSESWNSNHVIVGITNNISEDATFGGFVAGIPLN